MNQTEDKRKTDQNDLEKQGVQTGELHPDPVTDLQRDQLLLKKLKKADYCHISLEPETRDVVRRITGKAFGIYGDKYNYYGNALRIEVVKGMETSILNLKRIEIGLLVEAFVNRRRLAGPAGNPVECKLGFPMKRICICCHSIGREKMKSNLDGYDTIFVVWAFVVQLSLMVLFAVRKANLALILKYGWVFYLLCIPALAVSFIMLRGGKPFSFQLAGFLVLAWAIMGIVVEYILKIQWRDPVFAPIFIPYVLLYLGTVMFYWFPVGILNRPLWYLYAAMFAVGTYLNVTSH